LLRLRNILGDEFGVELRSFTPIRVAALEPLETRNRELMLDFHHAHYPAGVQDRSCRLATIERAKSYFLARSLEHRMTRYLLIYDFDWSWMEKHFQVDRECSPGSQ
jgi:hypothetical protein